jgi:hypothetical protein
MHDIVEEKRDFFVDRARGKAHDGLGSKRFTETTNLEGSSEPGTLILGRHHLKVESGHGERREIGQPLEGGLPGSWRRLNAVIQRGIKTPKGEWRQARRPGAADRSGFGEGPMR